MDILIFTRHIAVVLSLFICLPASASLIWDNGLLTPSNSEQGGLCSDCGNSGQQIYDSFTLTAHTSISSLDFGLSSIQQEVLAVMIYDAPGGNKLWETVYDWSTNLHTAVERKTYNITNLLTGGLDLGAGTYWFSFYGKNSGNAEYAGVEPSLISCAGGLCSELAESGIAFRLYGEPTLAAADTRVAQVPVPAPLPLLLAGLCALGVFARGRQPRS